MSKTCSSCRYQNKDKDFPICIKCLEDLLEYREWRPIVAAQSVGSQSAQATNNRSDEIAIQLQNAINFIPVDCASNIREARAIVMDCIAQLRAVR